ncbi:hypothetical protein DFO53_4087 [Enterobacter sp. AG5470]|nr:hypothetical protein DFO53_4087 [Enterobacter sp. AG5470]
MMIDKSKIIDGMVFVNDKNINETVVFNFHTWVEMIKAILLKYTDKLESEMDCLIYNNPLIENACDNYMAVIVRCHETEYHWAMLIAHGEQYWNKGISTQEPAGYFEWEKQFRDENKLAAESFEFNE